MSLDLCIPVPAVIPLSSLIHPERFMMKRCYPMALIVPVPAVVPLSAVLILNVVINERCYPIAAWRLTHSERRYPCSSTG